jgi:hypothetical protein
MAPVKMTLVLPLHHKWLSGLRGSSLIIENLLDREFGDEIGTDDTADRIAANKIVKAQKIIETMKAQKLKKKNEPPDKK